MKRKLKTLLALLATTISFAQFTHTRVYSTFDNLPLAKVDTFNNGADRSGGFTHYGRTFPNAYDTTWGSWSGWSLSNMTDDSTEGFGNQFSAKPGHGVSYTANYAVASGNTFIKLDSAIYISGAYLTNTTYAYYDMKNGSGFSKQFGGVSGNDADYFKLIIKGFLSGSEVSSVDFYLADFRNADNSKDYIIDDWTYVDFNNDDLNDVLVDSISFSYESSDVGQFGMNTPAYFGMDDFNAVSDIIMINYPLFETPEVLKDSFYNGSDNAGGMNIDYLFFPNKYNSDWGSWSGWSLSRMLDDSTPGYANQYSCVSSSERLFYVSGGQTNEIRAPYFGDEYTQNAISKTVAPWTMKIKVTNTTYAALDMKNGSAFSKKFGGADGNDPDYFLLKISYLNAKDSLVRFDSIYLADFRFSDNSQDYILQNWATIKEFYDANSKESHRIKFELESSDNGAFGMNTPAYFCLAIDYHWANIEQKNIVSFDLYPNPARDQVQVVAPERIKEISIYSTQGQQIRNMNVDIAYDHASINTTHLPEGVYIIHISTERGVAAKRFIKL